MTVTPAEPRRVRSYDHPSWWQAKPARLWMVLLAPILLFFCLFFVYPLLKVVLQSFLLPTLSIENYARVFATSTYLLLIWETIRISLLVSLGTLLVGYPIAAWLSRAHGTALMIGLMLVMLPLWTSALVRNYAWIVLLRRGGPVSNFIEFLGFETPNLLYNEATVVFGMVYTLLPYMVFTLFNSMRNIDGRLLQAAQGLGASPVSAFLRIYLPLSMPAVSAACLLVFIISVGFYITPALLGGGQVDMIAPQIDLQMNELTNWGFGAALSMVLFVIVALVMLISVGVLDVEALGLEKRQGRVAIVAETSTAATSELDMQAARRLSPMKPPQVMGHYGSARRPLSALFIRWYSLGLLVLLMVPIVVIAISSFTASNYIAFPPQGWSLRWYEQVMGSRNWLAAATLSLKVASLSAASAAILGTLTALCLVRGRFRGRQAFYLLVIAPLIVPTIVMAVGVYFLYIELGLLGSIWSFVFAYTVQCVPIVVLVVSSALRRVNVSLERSATILGASPVRAFFSVTMPVIWPSILAAALFSFIHAFDDVIIAQFIAGTTVMTLPKMMWVSLVYSIDPTISVVSTVFVAVSIILLLILAAVQGIAGRRAHADGD